MSHCRRHGNCKRSCFVVAISLRRRSYGDLSSGRLNARRKLISSSKWKTNDASLKFVAIRRGYPVRGKRSKIDVLSATIVLDCLRLGGLEDVIVASHVDVITLDWFVSLCDKLSGRIPDKRTRECAHSSRRNAE